MSESVFLSASLWRRLAAMVYDGLLMFAVIVVALIPPTILFSHGHGLSGFTGAIQVYVQIYLFSVIFVYLGWLWTHGGQTLGMRAWKIRLVQKDGTLPNWPRALFYYIVSWPMWIFLFYAHTALVHTPHWLVYGLVLVWFVFDHLPNNWREKVTGLQMVQIK